MIKILKAQPEDAKDINDLLSKTWLDTYPNKGAGISKQDIQKFTEESVHLRAEAIKNHGNNKKFLVAKEGDKLVGNALGLDNGDVYQLKAIYVFPEYQGRGVGQMLWQGLQEFFAEPKGIIVWVASYNTKAVSFYEKLGFVKTDKDLSDQHYEIAPGKFIPEIEMILRRK